MNLLHRGEGKRMMFPLTFYQTKASRGQVDLRKNPGNEADREKFWAKLLTSFSFYAKVYFVDCISQQRGGINETFN